VEKDGARQVRLDNRHLVTARPPRRQAASMLPGAGARVMIEMAPNDIQGWRLSRRP
jgi:hypothetical protein